MCASGPIVSSLLDISFAPRTEAVDSRTEEGTCSACWPFFASMKRPAAYCAKCELDV